MHGIATFLLIHFPASHTVTQVGTQGIKQGAASIQPPITAPYMYASKIQGNFPDTGSK